MTGKAQKRSNKNIIFTEKTHLISLVTPEAIRIRLPKHNSIHRYKNVTHKDSKLL